MVIVSGRCVMGCGGGQRNGAYVEGDGLIMGKKVSVLSGLAGSFLEEMTCLKDARSKRVSSWDRTGGNWDFLNISPGETATLADISGAGCIRHVYVTVGNLDRFFLRKMVLRMFWDDEETPSVEVPLGDFFGLGFCEPRYFTSLLVTVNTGAQPGGTIGLNNYFPMPFSTRALITVENDCEVPCPTFWYHIDYEEHDSIPSEVGRFHAQWRRENPCTAVQLADAKNLDGKENYVILEAQGWGNYVGMFLNVDNICGGWYGEGDDMIFIDGENWPPSMHGTGTEEIFGGGACPNVEYAGPYTGFHLVTSKDFAGKQSMYRFHVNDPVRFSKSIRVTLEHGHANDLGNDYSSTAFWYQKEPHAAFPELLGRDERLPRADDTFMQVYRKELEAYAVMGHIGGLPEYMRIVSQEHRAEVDRLRNELTHSLEEKNYKEAVKKAQGLCDVLAKYDT